MWRDCTGCAPMRSFMLVLLFAIGIQAVVPMVTAGGASCPPASSGQRQQEPSGGPALVPTVDPKLFSKRRYRSPRVRFSDQPPETEGTGVRAGEGTGVRAGEGTGVRARRRAGRQHESRGLLNVCESVSVWVGNKTSATDIRGRQVAVLPHVSINNVNKKQLFFETACHAERPEGSGCRGIDARHWNSHCTNSHTFVRALTSYQGLLGWRLIRINVACECVLSRKSWRH